MPFAITMPGMRNMVDAFQAPWSPLHLAYTGQQCEDFFFHRYFVANDHGRSRRRRTYLELGANDGHSMSNTHALYTHLGWRGVLIEATPDLCPRLGQNRHNDVIMCGAVCDASFGGNLTFTHGGLGSADTAVGHSVDMGTASSWSATTMSLQKHMRTSIVPCRPLSEFLRIAGLKFADLLSLDVEQQELRVLKTINWTDFGFGVGIVELECPGMTNVLSKQDGSVRRMLSKQGYTFVMRVRGNDVWVNKSLPWVSKGLKRIVQDAQSGSIPPCMIDPLCGDGKGSINSMA